MEIYELTHLFFRYMGELVYSPKALGLFYSYDDAKQAIQHFATQPGFRDNQDSFSIRIKTVIGRIVNDTVFEVVVYLHSEDFTVESEIELGLFNDEIIAQRELDRYCENNLRLLNIQGLVVEKIVNKCIIGNMDWREGFSISCEEIVSN